MPDRVDDALTPGRGMFAGGGDMVLALFSDPDARGSRRWREVFGYAPDDLSVSNSRAHFGREKWSGDSPISASAAPKSSSDC